MLLDVKTGLPHHHLGQSLRGGQVGSSNNPFRNDLTRPSLSSIMPPSIPAAPWRSLSSTTTRLPSTKTLTNTATTTTTITTTTSSLLRGFSTTPARRDVEIPPDSPRFLPLPDLPQSSEAKRPFVKGHLPVPREIFTRRAKMAHKLQPTFVADTAPRSRAEQAGLPPKSDKDAWKRLMAASRRDALASGLATLWRRKRTREARARGRADARQADHLAAKFAPDRPDEVYTRGTVTRATLDTRVVRDPAYEAKQLASRARTAALAASRAEARKDAVQRLYVEAGRFILTEEELTARVEELFSSDHFPKLGKQQSQAYWGAANIWEACGRPLRTSDMFSDTKNPGQRTDQYSKSAAKKTLHRQRIVAGELTGGALSVTGVIDVDSITEAARQQDEQDAEK